MAKKNAAKRPETAQVLSSEMLYQGPVFGLRRDELIEPTGLRTKLTRDELQGVIAHELSHIRNYDIRLMLLLTVLVGTVVMLADFFWQILRFSSPRDGRRDRGSGKDGGGPLALVLIIIAVVLALIPACRMSGRRTPQHSLRSKAALPRP